MNIIDEIQAFRIIAIDLLWMETADGKSPGLIAPRALFSSAVHALKRGTSFSKEEILLLMKEFLSVLDEKKIEIPDKDRNYFLGKNLKRRKKKPANWITPEVMRGAFGHEKRQPRDAI